MPVMKLARTPCLLFPFLLWGAWAEAACPTPDFRAEYEVRVSGVRVAKTEAEMRRIIIDGDSACEFTERSHPQGLSALVTNSRVQSSRFSYDGQTIRSVSYNSERKGGDDDENVTLEFLWEQRKVRNTREKSPWEINLPKGTLDMLTFTLGIAQGLKADQDNIRVKVATRGRIKRYEFTLEAQEPVAILKGETTNTLKVKRTDDKEDDSWIWFSPDYAFLPVKYEKQKSGGLRIIATMKKFRFTAQENKPDSG